MLDIVRLYNDYGILTPSYGNKHYREGWEQTLCPFCGSSHSYHLGYNLHAGYFNCWKCGWHSEFTTIQTLLNLTISQTKEVLELYKVRGFKDLPKTIKQKAEVCEFPLGTTPLKNNHRKYLISRGFNSKQLEQDWEVQGTANFGNYANRILIPIKYRGILCSYQGRDITGESNLRYKACKSEEEVIDHQHLVYGFDQAKQYKQCIVVEGVFDVWRLGFGAVSVFGIEFTRNQIYMLAKNFKKVYTMFDSGIGEETAQLQAKKLRSELMFRGVECENIICSAKDPAMLSQEEANKLMINLGF